MIPEGSERRVPRRGSARVGSGGAKSGCRDGVGRSRADAALLRAAEEDRRELHAGAREESADPLGTAELVSGEAPRVRAVAASFGRRPNACTASTCTRVAPCAASRGRSPSRHPPAESRRSRGSPPGARGPRAPRRRGRDAFEVFEIDPPVRANRDPLEPALPSAASASATRRTDGCSSRLVTSVPALGLSRSAVRPASPSSKKADRSARLFASVPPDVSTTSRTSHPASAATDCARGFDARPSHSSVGMNARRVGPRLARRIAHRIEDGGEGRRRGVPVEVDRGHEAQR